MTKSKALYTFAALLIGLSMLLVSCKSAATPVSTEVVAPPAVTEPPAGPVSIIIGVTDQIASLDPADAYSTHDWELIRNTGRTLLRWNPGTSDLVPDLATAMPAISADGLTYTVTMQSGVKFADGLELTAPMFAEQLNRLLTIGPSCPNDVADALAIPYVESITSTDNVTLVFKLKSAIAFFPQLLATAPYTPAHPTTFPTTECVLFPAAPVYGVGPWFISQFTQNEQVVLEPNTFYTGDLTPQSDKIIIRYFADPQTLALAVQKGEVDIAWRFLGPQLITQLQSTEGLTVGTVKGGAIRFLVLNHDMPPMDDPNVVKAMASAIDRNAIADTVYSGTVVPLYSPNPPGFLGASEAFDTMYKSPNLQAAKDFLAASGYTEANKCVLDLWYPPEHYGAETAAWMEIIKQQLEATGAFTVNLHAQEWATYIPALSGGQSYQAGVMGWFFDYPDPSNYLDPFVYNGGMGTDVALAETGSTFGKAINPKAQQLLDLLAAADVETDLTKRADLYKQAQDVFADLVVDIPLFFQAEHVTYRSNIHGSSTFGSPDTLNIGGNVEFDYSVLSKTP
ncbi:MAG: ABC transporter substrate-binding protein [Anaerolineaceae bacterium]